MRKLIAGLAIAAASVLGVTVAQDATPVQAASACSAQVINGRGVAGCSYGPGAVRVRLQCYGYNGYTYRYGPWIELPDWHVSSVGCAFGTNAVSASYQLWPGYQ